MPIHASSIKADGVQLDLSNIQKGKVMEFIATEGMNFGQAIEALYNGKKVKLPSWENKYLTWDDCNKCFIMNYQDTQRRYYIYNFENILSKNWIVID